MYTKYNNQAKLQYQIIGNQQQVLQYLLFPQQQVYLNQNLLYGSQYIYKISLNLLNSFSKSLRFRLQPSHLIPLKNQSQHVEYFGVKKGSGKILCLNVQLYKQMLLNIPKILALNYQHTQKIINIAMPNLRCFTPTIPSSNDMIFIQGSSSTYIQKQLGQGQKIIIKGDSILAISKTAKISKLKSDLIVQGPGFLFFQIIQDNKKSNFNWRYVLIFIIFWFLLQIMMTLMYEIMVMMV